MAFWNQLLHELKCGKRVCLLYVVSSKGSSPGRQGFKQFITINGEMFGSIGGGVMEQKLTDLAKHHLLENSNAPILKHQIHQTNIEKNKSGMICSGEQTVALYFLDATDISTIEAICNNTTSKFFIALNELGITHSISSTFDQPFLFESSDEKKWLHIEQTNIQNRIYIIGGGHVGLALSQTMKQIGFEVIVFDDRNGLSTMSENMFADRLEIIDYNKIEQHITQGDRTYIAIMTTGYRQDLIVLRKIIGLKVKYLGMLGSAAKVKKLLTELSSEGVSNELITNVHTPIGISIQSKTPQEIAISIAAQIIQIKNSSIDI
jgi:xanthine dehydrogenase accessory factor